MKSPSQYKAAQWPVSPRKISFYYGWIILLVSTIAMMGAVPASPPGMAPFMGPMVNEFQIDRGAFTFAYMIGTILAGFGTWKIGNLFDDFDCRWIGTLGMIGLGSALILTSFSDQLYRWMGIGPGPHTFTAVSILALCFFLIRFFGTGIMMTMSRSLIARWFTRHRAIAVSINGIVLSLSFTSAPILVYLLADTFGWRNAWLMMGLFFALVVSLLLAIFVRHSPTAAGVPMEIDRPSVSSPPLKVPGLPRGERHFPVYYDFSPREAARTYTFWIFLIGISLNGVIGTGMVMNLVAMAGDKGIAEATAVYFLLPSAFFNIITSLVFGAIGHKTDMRWCLAIMLVTQFFSTLGAWYFESGLGVFLFIAGGGIAWGCFGVLINLPWPRYFGSAHIGSINGLVSGLSIVTAAIGPYFFGQTREWFGTFNFALFISLLVLPFLAVLAVFAGNPQSRFEPTSP